MPAVCGLDACAARLPFSRPHRRRQVLYFDEVIMNEKIATLQVAYFLQHPGLLGI